MLICILILFLHSRQRHTEFVSKGKGTYTVCR